MKIYDSIIETIGNTPLVYLSHLGQGIGGRVAVKLEFLNPMSSVKDRTAANLIADAEERGLLSPGALVVEATSGNTGIGLACVCAAKGYRLAIVMPDNMSQERIQILKALGAQVELTPASSGIKGAVARTDEILKANPGSFAPRQFENPANPDAHRKTTAPEILRDTDGRVDIFIATSGTGGTFTGVSDVLKRHNPNIRCIVVEPAESSVIAGGEPHPHGIAGIGPGFVPDILCVALADEILPVKTEDAREMTRRLAREEGIFAGISSGAAAWAALHVASRPENVGKLIVTVLPDGGDRYLSTNVFA